MRPRALIHVLVATLAVGACGGQTAGPGAGTGDRDVITREQLVAHNFTSAYQAVESLHSNWLRTRGTDSFTSPGQVQVYLDDQRLGGVETLRSIPIQTIAYIRYYDSMAASARWGLDHGHGVIFVSTRI